MVLSNGIQRVRNSSSYINNNDNSTKMLVNTTKTPNGTNYHQPNAKFGRMRLRTKYMPRYNMTRRIQPKHRANITSMSNNIISKKLSDKNNSLGVNPSNLRLRINTNRIQHGYRNLNTGRRNFRLLKHKYIPYTGGKTGGNTRKTNIPFTTNNYNNQRINLDNLKLNLTSTSSQNFQDNIKKNYMINLNKNIQNTRKNFSNLLSKSHYQENIKNQEILNNAKKRSRYQSYKIYKVKDINKYNKFHKLMGRYNRTIKK